MDFSVKNSKTMARLTNLQTDTIAQSCIDLYKKLPKTGKPIDKEWTVLSCVVRYDSLTGNHEVVALGTGSKCIGATKMSPLGVVLNDSHAEVVARRAFLLYLYDNIDQAIENKPSIFTQYNGKFLLKENIQFIFYSSQLPCGDASIIPKTGEEDDFGDILQTKRQANTEICDIETKRIKLDIDIHRTGAKCLPDADQDPKQSGSEYHLVGQVRTKPGRGDRTLSVSCSDKIARWLHLGIQGSLLDMLLCEPIYVNHFIFGSGVPYSDESLNRALLMRDKESTFKVKHVPEFYQCSVQFPFIRKENDMRPAPGSIVWMKINNLTTEVAVQGKKLGLTKKKAAKLSSSLCISKYKLYERFQFLFQKHKQIRQLLFDQEPIENVPYNEMKRKSKRYIERWAEVKEKFFKTWTVKSDIWNFCYKRD